jgi:hypothetical protein
VIAKVEGSDPGAEGRVRRLHRALGPPRRRRARERRRDLQRREGQRVGHGALLEIGRVFASMQPAPKRSIVLLAVTAEEQGLLGAQYYAEHPIYPLEKTLANINIDGMNMWGRTRDVVVVGYGASDLDDYLREAAKAQGREVVPDPEPEKGFYYRSDHFHFAKNGVPALYTDEGIDFPGKPGFGLEVRERYTQGGLPPPVRRGEARLGRHRRRRRCEPASSTWARVANASAWPEWKPGNEFRAVREARLKGRTD